MLWLVLLVAVLVVEPLLHEPAPHDHLTERDAMPAVHVVGAFGSGNVVVTPGTGELTLEGLAPTVTIA
ncbi:MAG TPA: hypothetical protein VF981_07965 [Gemmatimonadaceae bacterium]